jgi:hypothetical protein
MDPLAFIPWTAIAAALIGAAVVLIGGVLLSMMGDR